MQTASMMGAPKQDELEILWDKYDSNADGQLQPSELTAMMADCAKAMHKELVTSKMPQLQAWPWGGCR